MTTKPRRNSHGVRLEERDLKILAALENWGVLGLGQINGLAFRRTVDPVQRSRFFFNRMPRREYWTAAYKRLAQLTKAGYIRTRQYVNLPQLYTLTEVGHREIRKRGRARFPGFRDSISDALIRHELHVGAVGLVLTELLGLSVRTEQERYVWSGRGGRNPAPEKYGISDLWIVDNEQPKAVEVEMTQKSKLRYREIWTTYRRRMPPNGKVLYLTKWPAGPQCILGHARRFLADFIYVCGLQQFQESCGRAPFVSYSKRRILLLQNVAPDPELESDKDACLSLAQGGLDLCT